MSTYSIQITRGPVIRLSESSLRAVGRFWGFRSSGSRRLLQRTKVHDDGTSQPHLLRAVMHPTSLFTLLGRRRPNGWWLSECRNVLASVHPTLTILYNRSQGNSCRGINHAVGVGASDSIGLLYLHSVHHARLGLPFVAASTGY